MRKPRLTDSALRELDEIFRGAAKHLTQAPKEARQALREVAGDYQRDRWFREIFDFSILDKK
jgi:plasmid stabilization system protein ParE